MVSTARGLENDLSAFSFFYRAGKRNILHRLFYDIPEKVPPFFQKLSNRHFNQFL